MDLKTKVLDLLKRAYEEEHALVAKLSDDERSAIGTHEQWSAKDIIAHLAAWKERMAQNLGAIARGEPPTVVDDFNRVNEEIFEEYRNQPWPDILAYSERAYGLSVESVEAMQDDDLVAEQDGRPLWRLIAGTGHSHPLLHLAQYYTDRSQADYATEIMEEGSNLLLELNDSLTWQGIVYYNLACHYALSGQKGKAISKLGKALRINPDLTEWSKEDPDFASIREDRDYRALYT